MDFIATDRHQIDFADVACTLTCRCGKINNVDVEMVNSGTNYYSTTTPNEAFVYLEVVCPDCGAKYQHT